MDVNKLLGDALTNAGCKIETINGIWYVTTPEGRVWDMTVPIQRPINKETERPELHVHEFK